MKKTLLFIITGLVILIAGIFLLLPYIKIDRNNQIKYISYTDIISELDEVTCYDDGLSYYQKKDITVKKIDIKKIGFFYIVTWDYVEGNLCDYEYQLEESYIQNYIENAKILENKNNINIAKLIKDKTAIVGNTRYFGNEYDNYVSYTLDGREEVLYVFYVDNLLIIQVGLSDEGPKFIAYK